MIVYVLNKEWVKRGKPTPLFDNQTATGWVKKHNTKLREPKMEEKEEESTAERVKIKKEITNDFSNIKTSSENSRKQLL